MHINSIHNPQDREQKEMLKQAKEHTENSDRHLEMNHVRNNENMSGLDCFPSPTRRQNENLTFSESGESNKDC